MSKGGDLRGCGFRARVRMEAHLIYPEASAPPHQGSHLSDATRSTKRKRAHRLTAINSRPGSPITDRLACEGTGKSVVGTAEAPP